MHQSIATISAPEFINLQPLELNPLMSQCEIKVLYLGENRNHSYITKDVAMEMAKTLRGAPIVGYYKDTKEDFADHGEKIIFDDEGIKFECMTKPYGFVSPDAKVWFKEFDDYDDFGNAVRREYLMTTGYLWTGQFEECADVVNAGRPQSMELDEDTLDGHWSKNVQTGVEFFIINDAIFSKLCILGDDVEPCFEGSSVTAPKVSHSYSLDGEFKNTLFSMMQDLKRFACTEGGQQMDNLENTVVETGVTEETNFSAAQDNSNEVGTTENHNFTEENSEDSSVGTEFKKDDEDKEEKPAAPGKEESPAEGKPEAKDDDEDEEKKKEATKHACKDEEDDEDKKKYSLLQESFDALKAEFSALETKYQELVQFKESIDNAKKDELIASFYMLSDEDKKDVIENKSKYSYDDIEAKLSVICVRKKVNFDLDNSSKNDNKVEETPVVTFNLESSESSVPAWVSALRNARK